MNKTLHGHILKRLDCKPQSEPGERLRRLVSRLFELQVTDIPCGDIDAEIIAPLEDADIVVRIELDYFCDMFTSLLGDLTEIFFSAIVRHFELPHDEETLDSFVEEIGTILEAIGTTHHSSRFEVFHRMYHIVKEEL
jgi:hypothetical protein